MRTVEGEVSRALQVLLPHPVSLTVAGRTDAGVHARGQVASYEGDVPPLRNLNALLPADVAVTAAEEMPAGFNARFDALSRRYTYRLHPRRYSSSPFERGRALWWPRRLDRDLLHACAAALPGEHDFTAFTPSETYHQRFRRIILSAEWVDLGPEAMEF